MKDVLMGISCVLLCVVGVFGSAGGIVYGIFAFDNSRDIPVYQYETVDTWIDERPELGDMFTEFTWEDNKLQRWEYNAISDKRDESIESVTIKKIQDKLGSE